MGLSDSPILLASIPVLFLVLFVFFLLVLTAVEARKVSVSKRVPEEDKEAEHPLDDNNSSNIEEDLYEAYAPIPVEYRDEIVSNIKRKQSVSAQSRADSDYAATTASTLLQLMVNQDSLSGDKVTGAIEVIQAEEEDQLEEVGRKPRPSINALRKRRKSSRIECFQMIEEKKFTNDMS